MKHINTLLCLVLLLIPASVYAKQYNVTPDMNCLEELDHDYNYVWKINWSLPAGEDIVDAQLKINNINNWLYEPNSNWLYIHLIDNIPSNGKKVGKNTWKWNDNGNGDAWKNQGVLVATYTDNTFNSENLSYDLCTLGYKNKLKQYAADGIFGIAFDPDCHYNDDGMVFSITTASVPEPTGLMALASGLLPLGSLLIRRKRSK